MVRAIIRLFDPVVSALEDPSRERGHAHAERNDARAVCDMVDRKGFDRSAVVIGNR